ncbi:MerR family transcriptional regulator [Streptomyces sp. NPDC058249]|uniref:MerR family transcriptional regulator n=1 Tax=Streptomyces sp. NPDC058249 TaxID=3346403 RepID=UPI0036DFFB9D
MRIGELAARAGISRDTIRFYEKVGLVTGRRLANGYRDFPPETLPWLHYVRTAQALGFSLAQIARHGEALRDQPDTAQALSALFEEKIQVIDARMAELAALRAELAARAGTGCPLRPARPPVREAEAAPADLPAAHPRPPAPAR